MFENILDQNAPVSRLSEDFASSRLPSSLLFFGPAYSGKLSTALELARGLSCTKDAIWSCSCADCQKQRFLTHPDLVMVGPRYFIQELEGSAEVLRRSQKPYARYLMIRAARKLTRRFDPWLWEGDESKLKKIRGSMDGIEEVLDSLDPEGDELPQKEVESLIAKILTESAKVVAGVNLNHIPIGTVRNIAAWAHTTSRGRGKTIIVENAESMLESARNAMLKILEEPPAGVHFILTSSKRGAIMPTILSRVRAYAFNERSESGEREVLERIFREPTGEFRSLRDYFGGFDLPAGEMHRHAETLIYTILGRENEGSLTELAVMLQKRRERFIPLLEESERVLRDLLQADGDRHLSSLEQTQKKISRARRMFEGYNQSAEVLLESLLYGEAG